MAEKNESESVELFFPYYVNQGRLLDVYAILNGGYSEYTEIISAVSGAKRDQARGETSANMGFKLFNFGASVSGEVSKDSAHQKENREKKVQTVTSVLSIVKSSLSERGYIKNIEDAQPGQFVCLPVNLSINSIKSLLTEMLDLLKLAGDMQKLGAAVKGIGKENKQNENIIKTMQTLFGGEEIVFETDNYAIIGNIVDSNLYQAVRTDIIKTDLTCLAQVKRIFPNGTELMKNTIFTKIKDVSAKEQLIKAISSIADGEFFDFEATAIPSIHGKPVYQLEIIALYQ